MLLIQSKDKLESIGYYYEPLSEKFNTLVDFSNMKTFRTIYNRIPVSVSKSSIDINKGKLSDFVTTLIRLKKDYNVHIPDSTTYIDPRKDIRFNNILSILNKNE
ncbi:protein J1 [BeAn 58058 virus]|uniref:protein J1 n=1 Tax=BeAn 58058 virus TaxID=67082 RepID=UPI00090B5889|nr:protein J1 [BeAn 58058 virus]APG58282.1 protein J1 [BeAn 58058 virus]